MPDIVVTEFMDEAAVDGLAHDHDLVYDRELFKKPDRLIAAVADARALIVRNQTQVRGALLGAAKKLKVVGRLGVGLDNIDLDACKARGIAVCPATGANDDSVAEYVVAAAMTLLRNAYGAAADMIAGKWPREALIGREIAGKTLGLVGYGAIARATATRARALGMNIAAHDPYLPAGDPAWLDAARCDLPALMAEADVISLHVPLTQETRHMIDANILSHCRPEAVLINAARGGVVDEDALIQALRRGGLAGAALDVFEAEPLTAASGARFAGLKNVILTPHIAGVTAESNARVSAVTAANVRRVLGAR